MFEKYCHVENTYQEDLLGKALAAGLGSVECICAVKIDGANFQVGIDENGEVSVGTRKNELSPKSDFYNWQEILERYEAVEKLKKAKEILGAKRLVTFGELCGGLYRHPDVAVAEGASRVQGRIDYSPRNEWVVFDMLTDGKYISQDRLQEVCAEIELPCQEVRFRGTLEECLKVSPEFIDETGHRLWGLPLVEKNVAEGLVIKPVEDVWIGEQRVVFKNKNPKYKERIRRTKENAQEELNELETEWLNKILEYVNESRVWSALSKLPPKPSFSDLQKETLSDIEADFREDFGEEFDRLVRSMDPKDFRVEKILKSVGKATGDAVRPVFVRECL